MVCVRDLEHLSDLAHLDLIIQGQSAHALADAGGDGKSRSVDGTLGRVLMTGSTLQRAGPEL
jgi:hypothetical protein